MTITYNGMTAAELNEHNARICDEFCFTKPGHRTEIYSDSTGELRRLRRSPHTCRPIVEELNSVYGYFATVAFVSEAWAKRHGLG